MKLRDIQLIQWPRDYRRRIRKAAEAEGLSVNEWLVRKVSGDLELPARAEMMGKATGILSVTTSGRSVDRHETRYSRLARKIKQLKNWIWRKESVFHEFVAPQYLHQFK